MSKFIFIRLTKDPKLKETYFADFYGLLLNFELKKSWVVQKCFDCHFILIELKNEFCQKHVVEI